MSSLGGYIDPRGAPDVTEVKVEIVGNARKILLSDFGVAMHYLWTLVIDERKYPNPPNAGDQPSALLQRLREWYDGFGGTLFFGWPLPEHDEDERWTKRPFPEDLFKFAFEDSIMSSMLERAKEGRGLLSEVDRFEFDHFMKVVTDTPITANVLPDDPVIRLWWEMQELRKAKKDQTLVARDIFEMVNDRIEAEWTSGRLAKGAEAKGEGRHGGACRTYRDHWGATTVCKETEEERREKLRKREAEKAEKPWWCPFGYGKDRCSYASCCHKCNASFNQGPR